MLNRLILLIALLAMTATAEETILRLATTTSTYETGLLDRILPRFEKRNNIKVHVISVGTGKAMKIAENGDVDVILVHAREAEDKFVKAGFGIERKDVMHNDFVILGPESDPAGVAGTRDAKKALKAIAESRAVFVSRGDDSGTHRKELSIWELADVRPAGAWYLESGQGMSATLRMADEKNGYVMVDRSTYLSFRKELRLKVAVEGDALLFNPYGIIPVNPERHKHVKKDLALKLVEWMTSGECQKLIGSYKKNGEQLFYPGAVTTGQER